MAEVFIGSLEIDAVPTEGHSFPSEVSEHPVEKGSDTTDNVRNLPVSLSLDCIVSDTPIGDLADRREDFTSPSVEAYNYLQEIRDKKEPVTVITSMDVFDNMILETLEVPRDAHTGDALRFRVTFKQIQLITNARVFVNVTLPKGKKKQNLGNRPAPNVSDITATDAEIRKTLTTPSAETSENASILYGVVH